MRGVSTMPSWTRVPLPSVFALAMLLGSAATTAAQQVRLLVVTGVEADPEDGLAMHKLAGALLDAAHTRDGGTAATWLADKSGVDAARIAGRSTREGVEQTIDEIGRKLAPATTVVIVLIGHGSFDGSHAAFNLPGPDLTAADWARLVGKLGSAPVAFINTASSSGAFIDPLKGPNRVVITATRTGGERNDPRFPDFFVEAFSNDAADRNRDGRISLAEAFEYAKNKVTQAYQQSGNILSEHATLEDGSNGSFASTLFLTADRAESALAAAAATDPELARLLEKRRTLEGQIATLRARKAGMNEAEYDRELEKLLTDLALKTRQVQERQGRKDRR